MSANAEPPAPTTAVRIVAVGGDAESARSHTLEAVTRAVEHGATDVLLTVRTSADGVAVAIADATTLRLWGQARAVAAQTVDELASLGYGGTRIPTLAAVIDVLAALPQPPRLVLSPATVGDFAAAQAALTAAPATGPDDGPDVVWCGSAQVVRAVRQVATDASVIVQLDQTSGIDAQLDDAAALASSGPAAVAVDLALVDAALVEAAHGRDLEVLVTGVDGAEQLSWVIDLHADQVATTQVQLLRQLATTGYSPLALAWTGPGLVAERLGLGGGFGDDLPRWLAVARHLAEWTISFTRTAGLGQVATKKHAADVVTDVDRAVEQHIRAVLGAEFPDHAVVGEEFGGEPGHDRPTWYLDPVDGTTNLANHVPWTSMSLALAVEGQPVVAVVCQPWTGEIYLAARGLGATLNGRPLQLGRVGSLAGRAVFMEMSAHQFFPGQVEIVQRLGEQHCATRVMGSGTLTLARVASGDGVGGLVHSFHPIDHLAGALIAHEAGARVLNEDGDDSLFPSGGGMLVAAPGAAEKLWPVWQPQEW
ncbi:inositol monophosphatase family protein [Propionibacteriaceae bacterium G1746]|uniref:inositol monophosphatase family protein n=1 Tax=Aestuariimicrobium sp. G57 TaxID=3418485 RepID=UPI003C15B550